MAFLFARIVSGYLLHKGSEAMGARWIKLSVVYLAVGIGFGLFMHATVQLQWAATHAHINVVGWLTTATIGVIYSVYPRAGETALAKTQFWLYNIGLPILLVGMFIIYVPSLKFMLQPVVWIGGSAVALSVLLFLINVWRNVHGKRGY